VEQGYQYQAVTQRLNISHMPKHALQYLRLETGWEAETFKPEEWTEEDAIAVGLGKKVCPHCMGSGYVERNFLGHLTRIKVTMPQACMCFFNRLFYSRWLNPANVPADYRNVRLRELATFTKNFATFPPGGKPDKLEDLIAKVTQYRYNCYLLVGPAGTGKTTLMVAMYHRALTGWAIQAFKSQNPTPAVWKVTATALAKQFREWELRDIGRDADTGAPTPSPEVTPNKVLAAVRAGYVPCLFIDELDKFKMNSEFQAKEFSAVIDAIQSNGGQVFASSNIGIEALTVALGEQFGPAIVRRLCGARLNPANPDNPADPEVGGFLVNFWRGTIETEPQDAHRAGRRVPSYRPCTFWNDEDRAVRKA
jgi:AAA domain